MAEFMLYMGLLFNALIVVTIFVIVYYLPKIVKLLKEINDKLK